MVLPFTSTETMYVIYQPCNHYTFNYFTDEALLRPRISDLLFKVYIILLLSAVFAIAGAVLHHLFDVGGHETALNCIFFVWWLKYFNGQRELYLCLCLFAWSMFFGATVGPMINWFVEIQQSSIIFFFGGYALLFFFHLFAIRIDSMRVIFTTNLFNLPLFMLTVVVAHSIIFHKALFNVDMPLKIQAIIPLVVFIPFIWHVGYFTFRSKTWIWSLGIPLNFQWLTFLTISFHYNLIHLMCIYMFVLFALYNLKLHTLKCICLAHVGCTDQTIPYSLTFFTEFLGRSSGLFIYCGRSLVEYIYNATRLDFEDIWIEGGTFFVTLWETGLIFCWETFKVVRAWFLQVKAYVDRLIVNSFVVVVLSIFFFMFIMSKAQAG